MSPSGPRTSRRPGSGPGRGSARSATGARRGSARPQTKAQPKAQTNAQAEVAGDEDQPAGRGRRTRSSLTTRALALGVVLLVLTISYASSLRVYFDQRRDIADTKAAIAQHQQAIADLTDEIAKWNDPAFVKRQAREQLGWVLPGETGYRVIGPDGKPVGPGAQINGAGRPDESETEAWWAKLFGSLEAADHPAPGQQGGPTTAPSSAPTVGPSSSPSKKR